MPASRSVPGMRQPRALDIVVVASGRGRTGAETSFRKGAQNENSQTHARPWAAVGWLEATRARRLCFGAEHPGRRWGGGGRGWWYLDTARRSGHREQSERLARPDDA